MKAVPKLALTLLILPAATARAEKTVIYYLSDPQGTPLAEADAAGNIVRTVDHRPYGVDAMATGSDDPGIGYTGHMRDVESDLIYMQARYYDSSLGRFLSVDPEAPKAGSLFFINRFAYANNAPTRYTDDHGDKPGDRFATPEAAALDALKFINGRSISENAEYQGYVVLRGVEFIATDAVPMSIDGGTTDGTPPGAVGDYHTHGDWSSWVMGVLTRTSDPSRDGVNSAQFSRKDIARYQAIAGMLGHTYRGYLGTPARSYRFYDSRSGLSGDLQSIVKQQEQAQAERRQQEHEEEQRIRDIMGARDDPAR